MKTINITQDILNGFKLMDETILRDNNIISFGYIHGVPVQIGQKNSRVTPDFDAKFADYIDSLQSDSNVYAKEFAADLQAMREDKVYQQSLNYDGVSEPWKNR